MFEFSKIVLIPEKKNYRIRYNNSYNDDKIMININSIYSPFGIENYNKKDILNLEIKNNTNDNFNILSQLIALDNYFENMKNTKFKNMIYISPLKNNNNTYLIRTHLSNKLKILTKNNDLDFTLKNKNFKVELEIAKLWTFEKDKTYGITLLVNLIDLN